MISLVERRKFNFENNIQLKEELNREFLKVYGSDNNDNTNAKIKAICWLKLAEKYRKQNKYYRTISFVFTCLYPILAFYLFNTKTFLLTCISTLIIFLFFIVEETLVSLSWNCYNKHIECKNLALFGVCSGTKNE